MDFAGTESGSGILFFLLGLGGAALVALVFHFYWVWRRAHGQLNSADRTVPNLAAPDREAEKPPAADSGRLRGGA